MIKPHPHSGSSITRTSNSIRLVCISAVVLCAACGNWITDPGPQPVYLDDSGYIPAMNVLGVLRPDSANGKPMSTVHIERSYPVNQIPDTIVIADAKVTVYAFDGNAAVDSAVFTYTDFGSVFKAFEYRHETFSPKAGSTYGIACERDGFPRLTAATTVPGVPRIVDDAIRLNSGELSFSIIRDRLAALYDVYFIAGDAVRNARVTRPETGTVPVKIRLEKDDPPAGLLVVYAYDLNLSEYITFNVSIKPNTFRSAYTTVQGGFGCFGSMNILKKWIAP
jgi:hypothetical protein